MNRSIITSNAHFVSIETEEKGIFHLDKKSISGPEFIALLDEIDISRAQAAKIAGVNRSSVTRWTKNGIPYAYLFTILASL